MSDRSHLARDAVATVGKWGAARVAVLLHTMMGTRATGRFGILYYHRVTERPASSPSPPLNVRPEQFREQMQSLLGRGYRFAPLSSVLEGVARGEDMPPKSVVITFDDGYASVWRNAWPVLRDLSIPATIFLATAYIGTGEPFPFDRWGRAFQKSAPPDAWLPLTWDQCLMMTDSGLIEVGTHTHTHRVFRGRPQELEHDLQASIEAIHSNLGVSPSLFAFPFGVAARGFASDSLAEAASRAGLRCSLTTEIDLAHPRQSPFGWGRIEATEWDTGATLAAKLAGWYAWMRGPRRLFQAISR